LTAHQTLQALRSHPERLFCCPLRIAAALLIAVALLVVPPAEARSVSEWEIMPRREATAYVVGVIGKMVADLAQPNPALAAALKEFFVRPAPARDVSEGLLKFYVEVSALDMLAGTGKLDPDKIQVEGVIVKLVQVTNLPPLTSDVWELYDVRNDFSLTRNLAAAQPAKLKDMQALFMKEARKYHVLPIDDRTIERTNPTLAGRPDVMGARTSLTLYEGMQGMLENTFMNIKNRSSKITADLDIPAGGANGAILSQGGRFGGWSLYLKDGKPAYTYNFLGLSRYTIVAPDPLATGPATVTLDFAYDGGGAGKGGKATLYVNGKPVAEGRVDTTQPNIFSADETADVGIDNQTPVAEGIGIGPETRFTGRINKVTLEVGK